jgi:hypothetical protein
MAGGDDPLATARAPSSPNQANGRGHRTAAPKETKPEKPVAERAEAVAERVATERAAIEKSKPVEVTPEAVAERVAAERANFERVAAQKEKPVGEAERTPIEVARPEHIAASHGPSATAHLTKVAGATGAFAAAEVVGTATVAAGGVYLEKRGLEGATPGEALKGAASEFGGTALSSAGSAVLSAAPLIGTWQLGKEAFNDFKSGNIISGAVNSVFTVASAAADVATVGSIVGAAAATFYAGGVGGAAIAPEAIAANVAARAAMAGVRKVAIAGAKLYLANAIATGVQATASATSWVANHWETTKAALSVGYADTKAAYYDIRYGKDATAEQKKGATKEQVARLETAIKKDFASMAPNAPDYPKMKKANAEGATELEAKRTAQADIAKTSTIEVQSTIRMPGQTESPLGSAAKNKMMASTMKPRAIVPGMNGPTFFGGDA